MPQIDELQRQLDALLTEGGPNAAFAANSSGQRPAERFSVFIPEQADRARDVAAEFGRLADAAPSAETGLAAVMAEAAALSVAESPELVRHAMMMFTTHHDTGRRLEVKALETRAPTKVLPSARPAPSGLVDPETQLNWFREDAKANEHHEHWHVVYPNRGLFNTNPPRLNDRHGELFLYMHQQMLARYDAERLAVGLPPVVPLSSYTNPIPEGYDPGPGLTQSPGPASLPAYAPRPANTYLRDLPPSLTIAAQQASESLLNQAIANGQFVTGAPVTATSLGATEETSIGRVHPSYGNHHGNGHVFVAYSTQQTPSQPPGVMIDTATAIRDPVFWRWHRHVDDMSFRWQETRNANDFSDAPPARVRKSLDGSPGGNQSPDIILAFKKSIVDASGQPADGQAFGESAFGGNNWDTDFSAGGAATDTLETAMLRRDIELPNGQKVPITYLDQTEFAYFIRVENLADAVTDVTVRIFIVPIDYAEDRRLWIEMDKFRHTLQPRQKAVIYRPAELSSVIKKPGVKPPSSKIDRPDNPASGTGAADENYCSCGWPYNLLLPRGTSAGMRFRLLVVLTDWSADQVRQSTCGSMSFCGARNLYPDARAMGYPFDRRFPGGSIANTIAAQENMATRDFIIKDTTP
ncbi:MAG TPA: tyrosinase family protein [Pyrinomonadaceae bacterium]